MCRHNLIHVFAPDEVAHLRTGIDAPKRRIGDGIPETDAPIRCASSTREQALLMGRPRDGFHRRGVLTIPQNWCRRVRAPYIQKVVVAARRELAVIVAPLESTYLALVPDKLVDVVVLHANVPLQNGAISAPAAQQLIRPRESTHSRAMPSHRQNLAAFARIPELHFALVGAHGEVRAPRRPRDRAHGVARREIAEFRNFARACAPEVNAGAQSNGEHVVATPVDKIEIKVVLKRRRVENLEGRPRHFSWRPAR